MGQSRAARRHPERHRRDDGVYVGYVHPDQVDAMWAGSMLNLVMADAKGPNRIVNAGGLVHVGSGPRIATARNDVVRAFLLTETPWLFMVDTDMVFQSNVLDQYLEHADPNEVPILGGLCFAGGKGATIKPTLYRVMQTPEGELVYTRIENYPRNAMCKVDATGAACLLVHRSVFERMTDKFGHLAHPWFAESETQSKELGEDMVFCLRAKSLGIPTHVHTGIKVGHRKMHVLDEQLYDEQQAAIAETGEQAFRERHARSLGLELTAVA